MSTTASSKTVKVTLVRSMHGRLKNHQACVRGLGLRRMHQTVAVIDTPENRGMMNRAYYMLKVEEPAEPRDDNPAASSNHES